MLKILQQRIKFVILQAEMNNAKSSEDFLICFSRLVFK